MVISSGEIKDCAICAFALALLDAERNANGGEYDYVDKEKVKILKSVEVTLRNFIDAVYSDFETRKRILVKLQKMMDVLVDGKAKEEGFLIGYIQTALHLLYLNLAENERGERKLSERLIILRDELIENVRKLIYAGSDDKLLSEKDYDCEQSAYKILSFARNC